jgi:hypothetical protein
MQAQRHRDRYVHESEHDYYWENIWMASERDFLTKYLPDQSVDVTLWIDEEWLNKAEIKT